MTPGRYVGAADQEDDGVPFEEKFAALAAQLDTQLTESARMADLIRRTLGRIPAHTGGEQ